jgi:hypothetical protein
MRRWGEILVFCFVVPTAGGHMGFVVFVSYACRDTLYAFLFSLPCLSLCFPQPSGRVALSAATRLLFLLRRKDA